MQQQRKDAMLRRALTLAKTTISAAMDFMLEVSPAEFVRHNAGSISIYLHSIECFTFFVLFYFNYIIAHISVRRFEKPVKYVRSRQEQEMASTGHILKKYTWPELFCYCTPNLRPYAIE